MDASSADRPDRVTRFHVSWLDRLVLHGRDPYRPVYLLRFERLRLALLAAVLLAVLGSGLIAWSGQQRAHQVCLKRDATSLQARKALIELTAAATERGDKRSAAVFRALTPSADLPTC